MKKVTFILLIAVLALSGAAMAQTDILGPHNVNGHGCASCHTPHNGAKGNGGTDATTGKMYLWGRDFIAKAYTQNSHGGAGNSFTTTATYTATDPLFHTAACLSCHDGSATVAGMTGQSFTTREGKQLPTYIGSDDLTNDHPVHESYVPGGYNWPATISPAGAITWTATTDGLLFPANTRGARFYGVASADGIAAGTAYVECSTCHNPHANNKAKVANVVRTTQFFIRGWYDGSNPASNSATQFCRQCHYSKSNEYVGIASTTN